MFVLFILLAFVAGCRAKAPEYQPVRGWGSVPIVVSEPEVPPAVARFGWTDSALRASGTAPLPEADSMTPGVRQAVARLAARDAARTELRRRAARLNVPGGRTLGDVAATDATVAGRMLSAAIAAAAETFTTDAQASRAVVDLTLELVPFADALAEVLDVPGADPQAGEARRSQAVSAARSAAQRAALDQATEDLTRKLLAVEVEPGVTLAQRVTQYPAMGPMVQEAIRRSRVVLSEERSGNWVLELEMDPEPVARIAAGRGPQAR